MMDVVRVEISNFSAWRVYESGLPNDPQWYSRAMGEAAQAYPGHRVRTVDSQGRVVDVW